MWAKQAQEGERERERACGPIFLNAFHFLDEAGVIEGLKVKTLAKK